MSVQLTSSETEACLAVFERCGPLRDVWSVSNALRRLHISQSSEALQQVVLSTCREDWATEGRPITFDVFTQIILHCKRRCADDAARTERLLPLQADLHEAQTSLINTSPHRNNTATPDGEISSYVLQALDSFGLDAEGVDMTPFQEAETEDPTPPTPGVTSTPPDEWLTPTPIKEHIAFPCQRRESNGLLLTEADFERAIYGDRAASDNPQVVRPSQGVDKRRRVSSKHAERGLSTLRCASFLMPITSQEETPLTSAQRGFYNEELPPHSLPPRALEMNGPRKRARKSRQNEGRGSTPPLTERGSDSESVEEGEEPMGLSSVADPTNRLRELSCAETSQHASTACDEVERSKRDSRYRPQRGVGVRARSSMPRQDRFDQWLRHDHCTVVSEARDIVARLGSSRQMYTGGVAAAGAVHGKKAWGLKLLAPSGDHEVKLGVCLEHGIEYHSWRMGMNCGEGRVLVRGEAVREVPFLHHGDLVAFHANAHSNELVIELNGTVVFAGTVRLPVWYPTVRLLHKDDAVQFVSCFQKHKPNPMPVTQTQPLHLHTKRQAEKRREGVTCRHTAKDIRFYVKGGSGGGGVAHDPEGGSLAEVSVASNTGFPSVLDTFEELVPTEAPRNDMMQYWTRCGGVLMNQDLQVGREECIPGALPRNLALPHPRILTSNTAFKSAVRICEGLDDACEHVHTDNAARMSTIRNNIIGEQYPMQRRKVADVRKGNSTPNSHAVLNAGISSANHQLSCLRVPLYASLMTKLPPDHSLLKAKREVRV